MDSLLKDIKDCRVCEAYLPNPPRPVVQASVHSKIVVIGQAPGRRVQESGVPWDDPSGDNLRKWLGVDKDTFYNPDIFALIPMGFCYPGTGKSGDFPPRKECAPLWHPRLFEQMKDVQLILLLGLYAQKYYLKEKAKSNLTETVKNFHEYLPTYIPLPHPSPRNNIWQKKNQWFQMDLLPLLSQSVSTVLDGGHLSV